MKKYEIVEGITLGGIPFFEIVEDDDWRYPSLGIFRKRVRAELKLAELKGASDEQPTHRPSPR